MGFRFQRTYALRWPAGSDLDGLEIDTRSASVATMREVRALRVSQDEERLAEILAGHITRWNLEGEDGEILPVTVDSLLAQESVLLAAIGKRVVPRGGGVSAPLDLGSTDSPPSVEQSIPMEM